MNHQDMKHFKLARKASKKSEFDSIHIGCVIVYKGVIIGTGWNSYKTHPEQKIYNQYRNIDNEGQRVHAIHAEMKALCSIPYEITKNIHWNKVKVYVYRSRISQPFGMARPCPACMQKLKDLGIKHIYYTTNSGYAEELILT